MLAHLGGEFLRQHLHDAVLGGLFVVEDDDPVELVILAQQCFNPLGIIDGILQSPIGGEVLISVDADNDSIGLVVKPDLALPPAGRILGDDA